MVSADLLPAVFLDRDGVLSRTTVFNRKSYAPRNLEDFKLLPNAINSVRRLKHFGFKVIVVTNQPDIGNGLVTAEIVEAMHNKLYRRTMVDDIFICAHRQDEGCQCRKPNPGMLIEASLKHSIDLTKSFMVGDRASDIEAGQRAGCRTVFINRHYNEPHPIGANANVGSLQSAVNFILANK